MRERDSGVENERERGLGEWRMRERVRRVENERERVRGMENASEG